MSPQPESLTSRVTKAVAELISLYLQQVPYRVDIPDKLHVIYRDLVHLAKQAGLPRPPTAKDTGPEDWQHEIEMWRLEALAQLDACSAGGKQAGRPSAKTVTVNERMAAMLQTDPQRVEWSASEWAQRLSSELGRSVSPAAVKQTLTWKKQIMVTRAMMKAERAARKR